VVARFAAAKSEGNKLGDQLEHVAKLIKARHEGHVHSQRDFFYVVVTGFDTHSDVGAVLTTNLGHIDAALDSFAQELKGQGVWGNVSLLTASDFARTLTSNGAGTDHVRPDSLPSRTHPNSSPRTGVGRQLLAGGRRRTRQKDARGVSR